MPTYLISEHVHVCLMTTGAILLDLRRDEYLTFNDVQTSVLQRVVSGWPAGPRVDSASHGPQAEAFLRDCLERGLITSRLPSGEQTKRTHLEPAQTSLTEKPPRRSTIHLRDVLGFIYAVMRARLALRFRRLDRVVAGLRRRKEHDAPACKTAEDDLQRLVETFMWLRPFAYSGHEKCLFDSLALSHFLAARDIFPTFVIGVRAGPFEAHAWVQHGRCALNCSAQYARSFSPIMTV